MCLTPKLKLCFFSVSGSGQSWDITLRLADDGKVEKIPPKLKLWWSSTFSCSEVEESLDVGDCDGNGNGDSNGDGEAFFLWPQLWQFSCSRDGERSRKMVFMQKSVKI